MFDDYSVACGSIDITPQMPIPLAGYTKLRKATFDRIADPLEANVIILRNAGDVVVFVAFDLMYVGAYLHNQLVTALTGRVHADAIFTSASHTHFGPPTEDSLPVLGAVTPAYRSFIARQVSEFVLRLLAGPSVPVSLEYLDGRASHSVNRRNKVFGLSRQFPFLGSQVRNEPNPSGPRDDTIRLIRMRDGSGKDVAVCWSYACHPVGFPQLNELSAEYPGVARQILRASAGNIPVVFWQGFSGNIGPLQAVNTGDTLPSRVPQTVSVSTPADWSQWARGLGHCVSDTARGQGSPIRGAVSCSVRSLPLSELGLSSEKQLRLHEIRLGRDIVICGLNAEVAVEYVATLRDLYAPARVIPVGCVGDVFGYLPVDAMVREKGYESSGFLPRFGLRGRFVPNVSAIVKERLFQCSQGIRESKAQGGASDQRGAGVAQGSGDRSAPTRAVDV